MIYYISLIGRLDNDPSHGKDSIIDSAIGAYEEYIALESEASYRNMAENEIEKLRNAANDQANN